MTLADPKFISLTTIQFGKKIKDKKKREFLDPRVTNITSGRHKQKGKMLAQRYQKKMLKCNKNNYKSTKRL
jgi:hypothetical protein